jgi:carboxylesterase
MGSYIMKFISILALIVLFTGAIVMINTVPVFYSEPYAYNKKDEPPLFDERAKGEFYENKNSSRLVILVHGYPSTPFTWKKIGKELSKSYNVLIPRLYGFGTTPGFFKKTYYSQWYGSLVDVYREYRKKYQDVTVCGLSFGGMLTLRLAEDYGNSREWNMKKIVVISAPVFLNNLKLGILYDPRLYLVRTISWFTDEIPSGRPPENIDNDGAEDLYLPGIYPRQIYSMLMGMRATRQNLYKIGVPVLLMHARGDKVVPFENMDYIFKHISSKEKSEYVFNLNGWKHVKHVLTMYNTTSGTVYSNIVDFIGK